MCFFQKHEADTFSAECVDRELTRLHDMLSMCISDKTASAVWEQIKEMETTLLSIAKRHNGLEY